MHIRGDDLISKFTLFARLYYTELGEVDQKSINFEINPAT
jgi:hypothetical protein